MPAKRQSVSTASPAVEGLGRVVKQPQLNLGSALIDAFHIDQGRTAGVKDADIGLQLPDKLERVVNQQGWIMAAW